MTRDEAVSEVQKVLGYRTDKVPEIQSLLLFQQQELENQADLPWFLREEILTLVSTPLIERMATPPGFIKEWQDDGLYIQRTDTTSNRIVWDKLAKDTPSFLRTTLQVDGTPGVPKGYNRDFNGYILFPTPDAIYTFRQIYYKADTTLTANIENKWLKFLPYLLIGRAGLRVAGATRDKDAIASFTFMVQEGMGRINNVNTELDEAGGRPVMGGED